MVQSFHNSRLTLDILLMKEQKKFLKVLGCSYLSSFVKKGYSFFNFYERGHLELKLALNIFFNGDDNKSLSIVLTF